MRFFALTGTHRHDLNADTEAGARHIAAQILKLPAYDLQTHEAYWASARGKAELRQTSREDAANRLRRFADARIRAIAPVDPDTLEALWPMLNHAAASPEITRIRAITAYAKALEPDPDPDYDPDADPNWP
jgi:hypothetical protein